MTAGLSARLNRISTNDRYLIVPMDHGLTMGAVDGLVDIESTIDGVTRGGADAVLTQKGIAPRVHPNKTTRATSSTSTDRPRSVPTRATSASPPPPRMRFERR